MKNNTNVSFLTNGYLNCNFTNGLIRYFGTFIFLIGIISTVLSICVFSRKPLRRKSCCFYFLILAISDTIHLLTMVIEHLPYGFHIDLLVLHTCICKITIFLIYFSNHLSNMVLTLASIDRFILIYCPSRARHYCNVGKAKQCVCVVVIILFLANGHFLYGYEKIPLIDKQFNISYDCNIRRENHFYNTLFRFYDSYIESVGKFYYYTFYASESIRQTVRKTFQEQGTTRLRDKDIQLCCMLIGTTFAFLILCLPTEINDIFLYTDRERSCSTWFRKILLMLLQQMYYAGHFYIYTLTGQLFRKHLFAILFKENQTKEENRFLPARLLGNFNNHYQRYKNSKEQKEKSKASFTTTSFIKTSTHRLPTKTIQSNLENTIERSQILASQVNHINTLQTKQIDRCQTNMDKSSKHLKDIEREMDELQEGFCIRLCCSSKSKKHKSRTVSADKTEEYKSNENFIPIERKFAYSNDQFQNLDENLQRLQYFNTLIDNELQDQLQTLNNLNKQVDTDAYNLTKANQKSKRLF
ncbi:hypothetical protein I4U23_031076 [Adineta vaga]|nr:hypothetical protein I4U23_031076 [Adineta vaga]